MTHSLISESICLSSGDSETEQSSEQTTNSCFEQKGRLCRSESQYRVFNDHYIEVRTRALLERGCHYELDCAFLDSDARRVLSIDWWSAAAFLVFVTGLMILASQYPSPAISETTAWICFALLGTAAALAFSLCLHRSRDNIVFYSRHGRAPLLKLLNRTAFFCIPMPLNQ